jgi:hypothetical protein
MIKLGIGDGWSTCLQTLRAYINYVNSVAFLYDSARLALALYNTTVKI